MPTIVIRLDPARLANPDLDLRYLLPDLAVERSGGMLGDEGYDYEETPGAPDDASPALLIFLGASDPGAGIRHVLELLEGTRLLGNDLRDGTRVGVSEQAPADATRFEIVYPRPAAGSREFLEVRSA